MAWNEKVHPRGAGGRFIKKGGAVGQVAKALEAKPTHFDYIQSKRPQGRIDVARDPSQVKAGQWVYSESSGWAKVIRVHPPSGRYRDGSLDLLDARTDSGSYGQYTHRHDATWVKNMVQSYNQWADAHERLAGQPGSDWAGRISDSIGRTHGLGLYDTLGIQAPDQYFTNRSAALTMRRADEMMRTGSSRAEVAKWLTEQARTITSEEDNQVSKIQMDPQTLRDRVKAGKKLLRDTAAALRRAGG